MIRRVITSSLAIAALACAPAALAQGGPPPPPRLCIFQPGAPKPLPAANATPLYVSAEAESQNVQSATYDARIKWAIKAKQVYGQPYSNIVAARFLQVSCRNSGGPFTTKKTCAVKAQPCDRP